MKLPSPLLIEKEKILNYLLNPFHRVGGSKARFFMRFGFTRDQWELLANALVQHGSDYEIVETSESNFGLRSIVEGKVKTPDGRNPVIRTVWELKKGTLAPRLITAYPMDEESV